LCAPDRGLDAPLGLIHAKDLLEATIERPDVPLEQLARPLGRVSEATLVAELLSQMRQQRRHMTLVADEHGTTVGLVTLEDLLEELVGAIDDEHDVPTPADPVRSIGDSRYEVDATLSVESLNERLGLHLPTDADYLTVGGLAFHSMGRVPEPGETFRANGARFTVVDVKDHRIRRLRIELTAADPVETRD
jgi:CBS domain containing-hemolysin-like protein